MTSEEEKTKCAWCEKPAINSHIIPRFARAVHRLVSRDQTLRSLGVPNKPVQDIQKVPLLCNVHDGSFSNEEKLFRERIYKPLLKGGSGFKYEEWLIKFAAFLSWKSLTRDLQILRADWTQADIEIAEKALSNFEDFARGKRDDPGSYEHHLLFTWPIPVSDGEFLWLLSRGWFGHEPLWRRNGSTGQNCLWVFSAMPGCILISAIHPDGSAPWINCAADTRILTKGEFPKDQHIPEPVIREWEERSYKAAIESVADISPEQRAKIRADAAKLRELNSPTIL
jgi:hypothetical protein